VADLLTAAGATRVLSMDMHAGQIQGFFNIPFDHLYAAPVLVEHMRPRVSDPDEVVIVSPDAGRASMAEKLANGLDSPFAIMIKKRPAHNQSVITHVIGDVSGHTPIIIEDLIDTGSTIVNVVEGLKERGAADAYVCATHGLFSDNALEKLKHPNIRQVVVTDSIAQPELHSPHVQVLSVAPMLARATQFILEGGSIAALFKDRGI